MNRVLPTWRWTAIYIAFGLALGVALGVFWPHTGIWAIAAISAPFVLALQAAERRSERRRAATKKRVSGG